MNISFENILNVICLIGLVILILSFTLKINNFFDIRSILHNHFKVFQNSYLQLISVYIVPIFFAIWITQQQQVTKDILDEINLVITILTSMFFAFIGIIGSLNMDKKDGNYKRVAEETFNSTLFEIMCCLILLLISFLIIFVNDYDNICFIKMISIPIYYFFIIIILNIFLILKRIQAIFKNS